MDAGGRPMMAPEMAPKTTQKLIASACLDASDQRMRTRREPMNVAAEWMLSVPNLARYQ